MLSCRGVQVAFIVILGMLMGMLFGANEWTKENHTTGGQLKDKDGNVVELGAMEALVKHEGILDMPRMIPEQLNAIKDIHFPIEWVASKQLAQFSSRVTGYMQQDDTRLTVFLAAPAPGGAKTELYIQPGKAFLLAPVMVCCKKQAPDCVVNQLSKDKECGLPGGKEESKVIAHVVVDKKQLAKDGAPARDPTR